MLVRLRGTTQADLAKAIGTYPSRVSEWVSERGSPSVQQAFRLARALDVTLDYLADDDQDQPAVMPMTEREKQVWEMVQAIGADEAWRRLIQAPTASTMEVSPHGEAAQDVGGARNEVGPRKAGGHAG